VDGKVVAAENPQIFVYESMTVIIYRLIIMRILAKEYVAESMSEILFTKR
jgi:hypothetical protein